MDMSQVQLVAREKASHAFKEFYKARLMEDKYEVKMHNTRLIYFLCNRGMKRILDKKKYKTIGEIDCLTSLLGIRDIRKAEINARTKGAASNRQSPGQHSPNTRSHSRRGSSAMTIGK
jgi:hypothetical protein